MMEKKLTKIFLERCSRVTELADRQIGGSAALLARRATGVRHGRRTKSGCG
jgi:hypothetical protein